MNQQKKQKKDVPEPLEKWQPIYNSLLRMEFCGDFESQPNSEVRCMFDSHFRCFLKKERSIKEDKVRFFDGDMLLGFSYLVLVRVNEYVKNELSEEERNNVLQIENWNLSGVCNIKTFDDLVKQYSINITKNESGGSHCSNETEKLNDFIRKLRNAISHYSFTYTGENEIEFTDNKMECKCKFKLPKFLQFCLRYGYAVNDALHRLCRPQK